MTNSIEIRSALESNGFAVSFIENTYNLCEKESDSIADMIIDCICDDASNFPAEFEGISIDGLKKAFAKSCIDALGCVKSEECYL